MSEELSVTQERVVLQDWCRYVKQYLEERSDPHLESDYDQLADLVVKIINEVGPH